MTSWRKDTPITATRDILLQGAQLSCQTAAPCPSGSPSWAASRHGAAVGRGRQLPSIPPQASPGHRAGSSPRPTGTPTELSPEPPVSRVLGCLSPHYKLPQT